VRTTATVLMPPIEECIVLMLVSLLVIAECLPVLLQLPVEFILGTNLVLHLGDLGVPSDSRRLS